MIWKMMKLRDIKQILTSFGEVSEWIREEEEGEVSHAWFELLHMKLPEDCDLSRYDTWKHKIDHKSTFCNLKTTYPAYLPNIFSSF